MAGIDYFFATLSPYTYLAGTRLEEIAAHHRYDIDYKVIDVLALFGRTGGTPPNERHVSRQEYRAQDLVRQAAELGVPFNLRPAHWPTNAAPSSYAFISAKRAGGGDLGALVQAFTRSCWADDLDIADDAVIRDCLVEAGFAPDLASADMLGAAETYIRNLEDAVAAGVFGVPFYITEDGQRFWGQDRLGALQAHLDRQARA